MKLEGDVSQLRVRFGIPDDAPAPNYPPSWNVAPTDRVPIVRFHPQQRHRTVDLMRWGLVPYWARDIKIGFSTINAMAETVDTRPVFREAFARRRCLVPAEAFYEWKKLRGKERQPYAIAIADGAIMAFAGLWETWTPPGAELVRSFTIVTTAPNALCAEIHDRMPVILPPAAWPAWLGEEPATPEALKALLRPYPAEDMMAWPVGRQVGNVRNNDRSLIEPLPAA